MGCAAASVVWLLSCARTQLEEPDLPPLGANIAGSANVAGNAGSANVAGSANGGAAGRFAGSSGTAGETFAGEGGGGPMLDPNLYVDPSTGNDANVGSRERPLRTIARAAVLARRGVDIVLLDGVYDSNSQPQFASTAHSPCGTDSGVVLPTNVTLRADHSGEARLSIASYHGLCSSGGRIQGLSIERTATGTYVVECESGELAIHESSFASPGDYADPHALPNAPLPTALLLSGSAKVTLTPGMLPNYSHGAIQRFVELRDSATLTMTGGTLTLADDPQSPNQAFDVGFRVADSATLTLHGVKVDTGRPSFNNALVTVADAAQVRLDEGTSATGFECVIQGTLGAYRVTLADVDFVDDQFGLFMLSPGDLQHKNVDISASHFTRQGRALYLYAVAMDLAIRDSAFDGSYLSPPFSEVAVEFAASGSAMLDHVTVTNGDSGLVFASFNAPLPLDVSLRNCQISSNASNGVWASAGENTMIDLGSVGSPGNNVFQGNGLADPDSANVTFGDSSPTTNPSGPVLAVGNTWDANVQGADAMGRYSVLGPGAVLDVSGGTGSNYRQLQNSTGTLRLAEAP